MKLLATIASLLATAGLCVAAATPAPAPAAPGPKQPRAPGLTYLYTVNITGGEAAFVGQGPRGFRIVVPIIKGSFSGPKGFKGKLTNPPAPSPPLSLPSQIPDGEREREKNQQKEVAEAKKKQAKSSPWAATGPSSTRTAP